MIIVLEKTFEPMDYSTINLAVLRRLPVYKLPPTYHVDGHFGSACAGDPPGFPSYFIQSVYTQYGNHPPHGPQSGVIRDPETGKLHILPAYDWSHGTQDGFRKRDRMPMRLWLPLPLDHPRVVRWEQGVYQHNAHCYVNHTEEKDSRGKVLDLLISPLPYYEKDSPMSRDSWFRDKGLETFEQAEVAYQAYVQSIETMNTLRAERRMKLCTPRWSLAVRRVREFYPDAPIRRAWLKYPPKLMQADWWERYAEPPLPSTCPGHLGWTHKMGIEKAQYCRLCGRSE